MPSSQEAETKQQTSQGSNKAGHCAVGGQREGGPGEGERETSQRVRCPDEQEQLVMVMVTGARGIQAEGGAL